MELERLALILSLATNVGTLAAFLLAMVGAFKARDHFLKQRTFDRMQMLYCLSMDLWRAGLTSQTQMRQDGVSSNHDALQLATYALKNWFHDNRFVFETSPCGALPELVHAAADEAKLIAETGNMSELKALLDELERRMTTIARRL